MGVQEVAPGSQVAQPWVLHEVHLTALDVAAGATVGASNMAQSSAGVDGLLVEDVRAQARVEAPTLSAGSADHGARDLVAIVGVPSREGYSIVRMTDSRYTRLDGGAGRRRAGVVMKNTYYVTTTWITHDEGEYTDWMTLFESAHPFEAVLVLRTAPDPDTPSGGTTCMCWTVPGSAVASQFDGRTYTVVVELIVMSRLDAGGS